jgi:hypothetical protein
MARREKQGWFDFAALIIGLNGVFNGFAGLGALLRKEVFAEGSLIFQQLQVWAWVWLLVGALQVLVAAALLNGSGRVPAIAIAAVSAAVSFASMGAYPIWSLVVIAFDVLVIYHLTTGEGARSPGALREPTSPERGTKPQIMR